jgi:hypothetical protein
MPGDHDCPACQIHFDVKGALFDWCTFLIQTRADCIFSPIELVPEVLEETNQQVIDALTAAGCRA